jgi:hypothetical protein
VLDPKAAYGPWVPHFLKADRAFGDDLEWRRAMKKPRDLAGRHQKQVEKAIKTVGKGGKGAWAAGLRAYEEAFLARDADELRRALAAALEGKPAPEPDAAPKLQAVAGARAQADKDAAKAIAAVVAAALQELETAAPSLFVKEPAPEK